MNLCLAHGGDVTQPSGGTTRVVSIASGLDERGFDVTLVVPEPEGEYPEPLENVDIRPVSTDLFGVSNALTRAEKITSTAKRVASERGAHLQLEHSTLAGIGTFRGCGNYILDMHDLAYGRFDHVDTSFAPVLKRGVSWIERRAVDRAAHIVVVSEYMREFLSTEWGIPANEITVVPNGYAPETIGGYEETTEIDGRVAFLGTLHPKVDVDAFERVASLPAVSEVVVIGDGALRDEVEALAADHDSIEAKGRLPDDEAFELLSSAAVAINPQSQSELQRSSSPVKLYYYAALGLPMVVAPGPTVVDELVEMDAAVTASESTVVADRVGELLANDERRKTIGENARGASEAFSWARRIDMFETTYRNTIGPQYE